MSCKLSPSAAAFSTMLSAFVGSVINGLCSGWLIAFVTGWISWLSVLRILAAGIYELHLTIKAGTNFDAVSTKYESVPMTRVEGENAIPDNTESQTILVADTEPPPRYSAHPPPSESEPAPKPSHFGTPAKMPMLRQIDHSVTLFGWLGWFWSAIYTPISQTIWVVVHLSTPTSGITYFVRALAIGVSALGLTFDYKARYGASLGRKWGPWAFLAFNAWNSTACLLLGVAALILLIRGAVSMPNLPIPLVVVYPIFSIIWAVVSWRILPPIDGGRPSNILAGVAMGAFAGLFVAAPGFAVWQSARFNSEVAEMMGWSAPVGLSLDEYLACEGASVWAKFAAVMP